MLNLRENLYNLMMNEIKEEAEKYEEIEGNMVLNNFAEIQKMLRDSVEIITGRDTMLCEDLNKIKEVQKESIKCLADILEILNN